MRRKRRTLLGESILDRLRWRFRDNGTDGLGGGASAPSRPMKGATSNRVTAGPPRASVRISTHRTPATRSHPTARAAERRPRGRLRRTRISGQGRPRLHSRPRASGKASARRRRRMAIRLRQISRTTGPSSSICSSRPRRIGRAITTRNSAGSLRRKRRAFSNTSSSRASRSNRKLGPNGKRRSSTSGGSDWSIETQTRAYTLLSRAYPTRSRPRSTSSSSGRRSSIATPPPS